MTEAELTDALDGFFAYFVGATDSGIRDDVLRRKVRDHLSGMDKATREATLARVVTTLEYEPEDAAQFAEWVSNDL